MRPDFGRIHRQQQHIAAFVGETATWRKYISASAGNPVYGIGDEPQYQQRIVTGLFNAVVFDETMQAGGVYYAGDIVAALIDCRPAGEDEILWSGVTYRAASDPLPEAILGRSAYRVILRRGDATD